MESGKQLEDLADQVRDQGQEGRLQSSRLQGSGLGFRVQGLKDRGLGSRIMVEASS